MAEINDLGDIQNGVEHISEVLDSMRAQNAMNAGDMDKVLANINSRLETLSNDENSDLIKVFLTELKRSLDERHNFVSSKFGEIENSFKNLVENAGQEIKADELRQLFEIIANNLNGFVGEVDAQKGLLNELNLKIEDLKQDDSGKKDILKNISVLKVEIEKFNNGFESIIVNLNDNFKDVSDAFLKIDPTGVLDSVKKDIENIFLSSNAVLSALQVIDRKNRDLEEVLNHLVTKEDFVLERDQVANLISQNIQLTDYISKLPTQDLVDSLGQKVDTAIGVINALKNVLNETSDQNQKMLVAQLDNLETKILNISSEEEFVGFKKELSNFAQEIIQSTNLMRADLMNTNSELQGLVSFLNAVDIKNTLEHFSGLAQIAEENIKVNLNELSEKFLNETEQTRSIVANNVKDNLQNVEQKIDSVERSIVDNSKNNFTNILENIQSVLANIFAMKNEIKVDNLENSENLGTKLQELQEGVLASKDAIVGNSQENLANLLEGIQTLSEQLEAAKDSVNNGSEINVEKIISTVEKLSSDLSSVKQVLSQSSRENLENILSNFQQLSQELAFSKTAVINHSQENFGNILSNIDKISQEILEVRQSLGQNSKENLENILSSVAQLSGELSSAKDGLSESSKENFDNILSIVGNFSQEISVLKDGLNQSSQGNLEYILSNLNRISHELSDVQNVLGQGSKENLENILSSVAQISQELSSIKESLTESSQSNFDNILSTVENFSQEISDLGENLSINSQSNFENIKAIADELSSNLGLFKSDVQLTAKSNTTWLKTTIEGLSQELQLVKEGLENKSQVNFENITSRIDEIAIKIEEAHDFTNTNLSENISELKNSISSLPAFIQENQTVFEDEKRVLIEQNSKNIEELVIKIQNLTKGIVSKDSPFKEEVLYEFANLNTVLTSVQEDLSQKNTQAAEEIKTNIQGLEGLISQISSGSEVSLYNLQTKLTEYLQLIQDTTQSSDLKLENSIKEIFEIKGEIQAVKEGVAALNSDTSLDELSGELNKKLEEILVSITQFEEISNLKNQDNLQKTLNILEEQFETVITSLDEHKSVSRASSLEILENLTEKITEIKEQVSGTNTDVVRILNTRVNEIVGGFTPIKETIEKLAEVDFAQIVDDLKNKLDESYATLTANINENLKEDKAEGFEKTSQMLSEAFGALNIKLENLHIEMDLKSADNKDDLKALLSELSSDLSGGIEKVVNMVRVNAEKLDEAADVDQNEFLSEKIDKIETNLLTNSQKNVKTLENTIRAVLEQLQGQTSISDKFEEVIGSAKEEVFERLDRLETNLVEGKDYASNNSKEEVFEKLEKLEATLILNQSDVQYSIIEKIENKLEENNSLERDNFEELISLKEDLLEEIGNVKNAIQEKNNSLAKGSLEEVTSLKAELLEAINSSTNEFQNENSDKIDYIKSEIGLIIREINNSKNENSTLTRDNFEELISLKVELLEEISKAKNENSSLTRENLEEITSLKTELLERIKTSPSITDEENSYKMDYIKFSVDEIIKEIGSVKSTIQEEDSDKIDYIKSEMGEIVKEITKAQEGLSSYKLDIAQLLKVKDEDVISQFSSIENTILDGISQNVEEFKTTVEATAQQIEDKISLSEENYKSSTQTLLSEIKSSFYSKVEDNLDDLKSFMEVLEGRTDYNLSIDNLKSEVFEKFSILADDIEEAVSSISVKKDLDALRVSVEISTNELLETLYDRIVLAIEDDKVTQEVLEKSQELACRVEDLKRVVTEDVSDKLDGFGLSIEKQSTDFSNLISEIAVSLVELKENYVDLSLNSSMEISNLLSTVQDKIDNISNRLDKYDFSSIVESAKSQLLQEIASVKDGLSTINIADSISDDFQLINQKLDVMSMGSDDLESNIGEIKESIQSQSKFIENLKDLEQLEKLSKLDGFSEDFQVINQKLEVINNASRGLGTGIIEIKNSISQDKFADDFQLINQKLDVMNTSSDSLESDISEIKDNIQSQNKFIEDLKALENLDKLSKLDGASEVQNDIKKILSEFEARLNTIASQKVENKDQSLEIKDELKSLKKEFIESVLNLFDQISFVVEAEDIKDFVNEKSEDIKAFVDEKASKQLEKLSKLDGVSEDFQLINQKLDCISISSDDLESDINEIKKSLYDFEGKLGIVNLNRPENKGQFSEIKDFVEEKAEDVKSSLGNNFNDILSSLEILHDKTKSFDGGYGDIKNEIVDLKKHIQVFQNATGDSSEYSYTFQDIESDITKVRLILNEISKSKSDESFDQLEMLDKLDRLSGLDKLGDLDKMTEDIMSISTRTNKLLLTSDESYNNLKVNLDEFRNIVYNLEDKVKYLDNREVNDRIEKKLETVNELTISSVKSDKIFNQAFTYLAEWVDSAAEDMTSINEKVSEIQSVKQSIAEIKKTVSKKTDLADMLDEISDKFEQQQIKIERLEEKIDELASKKTKSSSKIDIEAIVAEVLAQVGGSEGKADIKMTKKVDGIEKQLTKLSKNIEKLTSYVDAE